jgi:hypothetical protein
MFATKKEIGPSNAQRAIYFAVGHPPRGRRNSVQRQLDSSPDAMRRRGLTTSPPRPNHAGGADQIYDGRIDTNC